MKKHFVFLAIILLVLAQLSLTAQDKESKGLKVREAHLGKDVQNKKIVDTTTTFALNEKAYLWFRLVGGPSDSITVTWKTGDQTYPSRLNVGGTPWRTWSYKTLSSPGDWTVTITDAGGSVLRDMSFKVLADTVKH